MITGDYPGTALAIARTAGIPDGHGCLTGMDVESLDAEQLAEAARTVSVFARMVPERKLALVRALQADGEVVGMTGDGVNDAPALRASDVGIAMGVAARMSPARPPISSWSTMTTRPSWRASGRGVAFSPIYAKR